MPRECPGITGLECAARCVPARGIGGDYYDWVRLADSETAFMLADVSGKGIAAALLVAHLQGLLRSKLAAGIQHPLDLVAEVSGQFFECSPAAQYATLFFARYDAVTRTLRYINAAHQPALLLRSDESVHRLGATGLPLGIFPDWTG